MVQIYIPKLLETSFENSFCLIILSFLSTNQNGIINNDFTVFCINC